MSSTRYLSASAALVCLLLVPMVTTAAAQGGDAGLRGTVTDEQGGALPGVTVTVAGPALLSPSVAVTDAGGQYRIVNLPPGAGYTLTAELTGFAVFRREGILMRAGATFQVDATLTIGSLAETITVSGESPMIEVAAPSNVLNIDGDFQRQLPLVENKSWVAFLEMTPGVYSRVQTDSSQRQNYFGNATGQRDNVADVEGLNASNYNDTTINRVALSSEAMEDVQVKTGGVDAGAPMGQGLVINVIGKSGGNNFHGSLGETLQPMSWVNNNVPGGTPAQRRIEQTDASLGGPIVRDGVWFFGAMRYQRNRSVPGRTAERIAELRALFPSETEDQSQFDGFQPFAKVTARLSNSHTLTGIYQADRLMLFVVYENALRADEVSQMGGGLYGAKLTSVWGQNVTTTFLVGYNNKGGNTLDSYDGRLRPGPATNTYQTVTAQQGRLTGNGWIGRSGANRAQGCNGCMLLDTAALPQFRGDLTWFKKGGGGSHEVQTGFLALPHIKFDRQTIHLNNGVINENRVLLNATNPGGGTRAFQQRLVTSELESTDLLQTHSNLGLYVQDTWRPTGRLTATFGVRVDLVKRHDDLDNFQIQSSTEVGPRFGASYLLTSDAKNVLRGTYARVHENMQGGTNPIGTFGSSVVSSFRDVYDLDGNGTFETAFDTPAVKALQSLKFSDDLSQPLIDEWILGYRRQFPGQVAIDVAGIGRTLRKRFQQVDLNGLYPDGPFQPFGGFGRLDPNLGRINQMQNATWNEGQYRALQITMTKNVTRGFQAMVSLHRQWQWMTGTWNPTDPARFIQPDAFDNNRLIDKTEETNGISYPGGSNATMWAPFSYRFSAAWNGPAGVLVSGTYSAIAGRWSGPIVDQLAANDPNVLQFGPATVRSSTGVTQSNPLATRIRFVNANQGEGQVLLPAQHNIGIKLGKKFRFGGSRELETGFNVMNLLNAARGQNWDTGANQKYSANYLKPSLIQPSRAYQLDMMFRF